MPDTVVERNTVAPIGNIDKKLITKFDTYTAPDTYTGEVEIQGIKEYKVNRNKLWKEAKRNMAGELNAVFIGIFPKLEVKIKVTTATYLKTLIGLFDTPYLKLRWFDPLTEDYKRGTFYMNDYSNELISKIGLITGHTTATQTGVPIPDSNPPATKTVITTTPILEQFYKEFDIHFIPVKRGGNDL
jgi:hypothetical protein